MLCAFYIDLRITVHINVTAILTDLRLHPVLVQLRGDDPWLDHSPAGSGLAGQQVREDFVQLYYVQQVWLLTDTFRYRDTIHFLKGFQIFPQYHGSRSVV